MAVKQGVNVFSIVLARKVLRTPPNTTHFDNKRAPGFFVIVPVKLIIDGRSVKIILECFRVHQKSVHML